MNDLDIPILKKTYELYSTFHEYRRIVSKADRFTIYERSENLIIDIIEFLLEAGYIKSNNKSIPLEKASGKLNTLRFLIRLMKETKTFDLKKYTILQAKIDEIGRMLGGWIRSSLIR
ncbi:MAG: four helix bundle protein [Patescibacteria group bacterium]|mgnify:CR=1 FL=1